VFTAEERDRVRERVLELAEADPRVVAGAVVGAEAVGPGDRWSDLDLTFGVEGGVVVAAVLEDFTRAVTDEFDAIRLFDLARGELVYRVFLFPGLLQVDLSFGPSSEFGARGPRFRLLFGEAADTPFFPSPDPADLFGLAAHHAVRARFCIERGRLWQAEYWLSALRDHALELACLRRGLPANEGRGFDQLPEDAREAFAGAIVRRLAADELLRALAVATEGLLREGVEAGEVVARVEPRLRALVA
jgi:hypothetical protein